MIRHVIIFSGNKIPTYNTGIFVPYTLFNNYFVPVIFLTETKINDTVSHFLNNNKKFQNYNFANRITDSQTFISNQNSYKRNTNLKKDGLTKP